MVSPRVQYCVVSRSRSEDLGLYEEAVPLPPHEGSDVGTPWLFKQVPTGNKLHFTVHHIGVTRDLSGQFVSSAVVSL